MCYIIDVCHSQPSSHRDAVDMLYADCDNVTRYFEDRGCAVLPYDTIVSMIGDGDGVGAGVVGGDDATAAAAATDVGSGGAAGAGSGVSAPAPASTTTTAATATAAAASDSDDERDPADDEGTYRFELPEDAVEQLSPFLRAVIAKMGV